MEINEINLVLQEAFDRVKRMTALKKLKILSFLTQENMQHVLNYEIVQNVGYDYIRL